MRTQSITVAAAETILGPSSLVALWHSLKSSSQI